MIWSWSPRTSKGETLLRSSGITCLRFQSPQANWKKLSQGSVVRSIAPSRDAAVWTHSGVKQIGVDPRDDEDGERWGGSWGEVRNRQGWRKHRMRMRTRQRRRMRISPQRSQAVLCLLQAITLVLAHAGQSKVDDVSVGLEDVNTETRPSAAPRKLCSSTSGSSGSRVLVREGSGEVLADEIGILAVCVCGCHPKMWHHRWFHYYHKSITLTPMNASSNLRYREC